MNTTPGSHQKSQKSIAVFASGAGSNAQKIIEHFNSSPLAKVELVVCNKPHAGVVQIAESFKIKVLLIERQRFLEGDAYLPELAHIDFIVLAGFLWKIPEPLIVQFRNLIINIHPALLPAYGGKGMYGANVHQAVVDNSETQSGITIHYVDEHYDNGDVIFQAMCNVLPNDTAQSLAQKIHALEHEHFPRVVEACIEKL